MFRDRILWISTLKPNLALRMASDWKEKKDDATMSRAASPGASPAWLVGLHVHDLHDWIYIISRFCHSLEILSFILEDLLLSQGNSIGGGKIPCAGREVLKLIQETLCTAELHTWAFGWISNVRQCKAPGAIDLHWPAGYQIFLAADSSRRRVYPWDNSSARKIRSLLCKVDPMQIAEAIKLQEMVSWITSIFTLSLKSTLWQLATIR